MSQNVKSMKNFFRALHVSHTPGEIVKFCNTCSEIKESAVKPQSFLTYEEVRKVWQTPPTLAMNFSNFSSLVFLSMDVFNQKPFPLKHALTQQVSQPLCNRQSSGEFIWWRALLDLFVAPKRLTTRKLPLFCSDKWFWWEEGRRKSVCESLPKTWGFSQLNYIKRQSPTDTHTHTCWYLKMNMHKYRMLSHLWLISFSRKCRNWGFLLKWRGNDEAGCFSVSIQPQSPCVFSSVFFKPTLAEL